ncbi:MAG TPA: DUF1330 domain-containing protein [Mycobacteriales bacterium]|jgi:uncharacterized protein (DUF1330 family)|nr:DUF1330 domain-containing protein [Mycobacteriales bacterium]
MSGAYWVSTVTAVHDAAKLEAYVRLAAPALAAAGGRLLARGHPVAAFEAGTTARTTLLEFPGVEAAVAAYHSDAYQEALRVLGDGAEREIRILAAVEQPAPPAGRPGPPAGPAGEVPPGGHRADTV